MNSVIRHLEKKGMPILWQFLIFSIALLTIVAPLFFKYQDLTYAFLMLTHPILFIGVYMGFRSHKEINIPRLILAIGIGLIIIGQSIQHFIYFQVPFSANLSLLIEEVGIILITAFAYIHILMFEKKFQLKGFSIDYTLLIISAALLLLLVSPNLLNIILFKFDFYQQVIVFNLFISATILSLSIIHFLLTRSIGLTDGVRMALTILLVINFSLEVLLRFETFNNTELINTLSLSAYHLAGALAILFVFTEDLTLDFSAIAPTRVGNLFMWISSIFAIVAIPIGLIIRSMTDAPHLDHLLIGITSILISTVVIWRILILIKNANKQKEVLNSLIKTNIISGLPNYHGYLEQLSLSEIKNILVIHLNIEDFKSINDLYGRDTGDQVLRNLANKIDKLPKRLLSAHIQSDQFLVAFQTEESQINNLIHRIQKNLGSLDNILGESIAVPITMGASFNETSDPEKLAKEAEIALKSARREHKSFVLYTEENVSHKIPRNELRQILQQSVDDSYLPVHFQPIYNLNDGSLKALELLIRVDSKEHGLLQPSQFLEQAKSYALLTSLTQICIKMISKHKDEIGNTTVNFNLPPYMLKSTNILLNFIQYFKEEKLIPENFCIEITEDEDISAHELIPAIKILKQHGFAIAMDDFGTGYSSLDRLSVLDVDTVKIDRSILLTAESGNNTILEWAISLTKRLGVSVVVEGVETLEQLALIKLLGADSVQGFLYSKPVSALQIKNIPLNSNDIKLT